MILKIFIIYWLISALICLPHLEKFVEEVLGELDTKIKFTVILFSLIFGGLIIIDATFRKLTGKELI